MKHFEVEEIARFAEGNVHDSQQERFITHLAQCEACFKAYADTLKFVEEENKSKHILKFPGFEKLKIALQGFWQQVGMLFKSRRTVLVPAFAMLMMILLIVPYSLKMLHDSKIENAQIQQITMDIENMDTQGFAPARDEIYAAVRAGIFVRDLEIVVNAGRNEELEAKITNMLSSDLKVFDGEEGPLFRDLANISKKNFKEVVKGIRELLEKRSRSELFQLGRFLEHSILSTIANKLPNLEDMEKYQRIVREHGLPQGILNKLKKLKKSTGVKESKEILMAIKEIILS